MESQQMLSVIAVALSAITLLIMAGEKLFGGGNRLAGLFHKLDKDTTTAMSLLRDSLTQRVDNYEDNARVGFEAIRSNIHELQLSMLRLRAETAESLHLYIRKDDYQSVNSDLKRDMKEGFDRIERRLDRIEHPGDSHA